MEKTVVLPSATGVLLLIVGAALSFHFVIYSGGISIIPKEHLTFADTFVDLDELIQTYNGKNWLERLRGDGLNLYLVGKLKEKKLMVMMERQQQTENPIGRGSAAAQEFRISYDVGSVSTELCTETMTMPNVKHPLCYMRHWKPWISNLAEQVAGKDYAAIQADTGTQSPTEEILEFPNERHYVLFEGCREHSCNESYAYFLVDPAKREIEIIWISEAQGVRFLGPNSDILKTTNAFGWLCAYSAQQAQLWGQFGRSIPASCSGDSGSR